MTDLTFEAKLNWSGRGKEGEGKVKMGEESLTYSSPANMGGKGIGVSPEDLLIAAVSSCYSGTLFGLLVKTGLPVQQVSIRAEGVVTGYPLNAKFGKLIVHPTIIGGDASKQDEYETLAIKARDKCFIGKAIAGNVEYEVGTVTVKTILLPQSQVDELVERFYSHLTKDNYFSAMFAERNVDIDQLKERQRVFISRMINDDAPEEEQGNHKQVQKRHNFSTTPERAKIWLGNMEKTIDEMKLSPEIKETIMSKMNLLMGNLVEK